MPTKATRKWQPGDQTPRERARMLGERIAQAMQQANLNSKQLARLLDRTAAHVEKAVRGEFEPLRKELMMIAMFCEVDSRWLATAEPSPTASAALELIREAALPAGIRTHAMVIQFVRERILRTPQPIIRLGQCRYCACTYHEACEGGCSWVDVDETICSACLDPERVDG